MTFAIADLSRLIDPYRSKAEAQWTRISYLYIEDWFKCQVVRELYEPISLKLPCGNYTPDFMVILSDGRVVFVEVKGSTRQKNYRDARSKLRAAAEVYPFFIFMQATGRLEAWELEEIKP